MESYIALYQREHSGSVPPNIHTLYDYLTMNGETNWYAAPAAVVSTRYVEPLRTASGGGANLSGTQVIAAATGGSTAAPSAPQAVAMPVAVPEARRPATVRKVKAAQ